MTVTLFFFIVLYNYKMKHQVTENEEIRKKCLFVSSDLKHYFFGPDILSPPKSLPVCLKIQFGVEEPEERDRFF